MGIVILCGLLSSTALNVFVVPALYRQFGTLARATDRDGKCAGAALALGSLSYGVHDALEHEHLHTHDLHHQHDHGSGEPGTEPHAHRHRHTALVHDHPHLPDAHHRHGH